MNCAVRSLLVCASLLSSMEGGLSPALFAAQDYAATIRATPGLQAYYRCETSETTVADDSKHQRPAAIVGKVMAIEESAHRGLGRALHLAEGAHLRIPALGRSPTVSIELWIRLRNAPSAGLAGIYAADGWQPGWLHFNLAAGGDVELAVHGANPYPRSEPETVPLNRWVHLVMTYDQGSGEELLYCDGRPVLQAVVSPAPEVELVSASLGAWLNGSATRPVDADVDEIAIYTAALSPAQVRQHYQLAKGISPEPVDFAATIRPLLEARCFGCHGPETQEGHLRLDVRDSTLRGGDSGEPAVAPYSSDLSQLMSRVTSTDREHQMPPPGEERLSLAEIAALRHWIDQGAIWPDSLAGSLPEETVVTKHWSFQPVAKPTPPVSDQLFVTNGTPIDAFILQRLTEHGLSPSSEADRRTLIRRLFLDLHGLPPTPELVQEFINDSSPEAWQTLVEKALASPRYGERWAAHWLDVIRYGETHGFEVNTPRDNAWPYRDYVIHSLNIDKPYDVFLREQIAGDQLGVDAATGLLVAAPALLQGQVGRDEASKRLARADELHEVIVTIGSGVLGLTVGCARCHNHKFDPISQSDYYELQAIFAGLRYGDRPLRSPESIRLSPDVPTATAIFGGTFTTAPAVHRLYRGDPMQRRERVSPDIPAVFGSLNLEITAKEAERRLALAAWLTSPQNPLTARVMVNRVWQHHFGRGLVSTPSDFGAMGRPPSHPELLDYLASRFMEQNWSLKAIHREILLSQTYQQSSFPRPEGLALDAASQWLWRFPPRRLEMEPIRDSILAVSGKLDLTMGGPGFMVFKPNTNYVRVYDAKDEWGPAEWRRMIYAHRVRMAQDGVFGAFDCPDAGQPQPQRSRSTTAIQALNLLNSSFTRQQARFFAERAMQETGTDATARIQRVFSLAYQRAASPEEVQTAAEIADEFGLQTVCLAILNSNEFLFLP